MYLLKIIILLSFITENLYSNYNTQRLIQIFKLPLSTEQEVFVNQLQNVLVGVEDPFAESSKALLREHERLFIEFFLSRLPNDIRQRVLEVYNKRVFNDTLDQPSIYVFETNMVEISLPRRYWQSGLGSFLLIHEMVHAAQDFLGELVRPEHNMDLESIKFNKHLFQNEKTAMDWEWLYLQTLPKVIRAKLIQDIIEIKDSARLSFEQKYELYQYKFTIEQSLNPRIEYLIANWEHLLRYSPRTYYMNTSRYNFKSSLWKFIKDSLKQTCQAYWLRYQIYIF